MAVLKQIRNYPIKGLSGRDLDRVTLQMDRGIPGDRQFAMTIKDEIDGSRWMSSRSYLINAVNDGLLQMPTVWSGSSITVMIPGGETLEMNTETGIGIDQFNQRLPELLSETLPPSARPRLIERGTTMVPSAHWDYPDSQLSVMNMETLRVLSTALDETLEMDRFRGNLIIDELPGWSESGLAGWRYRLGDAEIEFGRPVRRCAATAVNPQTGLRDVAVNTLLAENFGHGYFGMYARVVKAGAICCGDRLTRLGAAAWRPDQAMVEGASPYALWPKLADIEGAHEQSDGLKLVLKPTNPWPLVDEAKSGQLKLHIGQKHILRASIIGQVDDRIHVLLAHDVAAGLTVDHLPQSVVITGPFGR